MINNLKTQISKIHWQQYWKSSITFSIWTAAIQANQLPVTLPRFLSSTFQKRTFDTGLYTPDILPVTQATTSKHWRNTKHCNSNQWSGLILTSSIITHLKEKGAALYTTSPNQWPGLFIHYHTPERNGRYSLHHFSNTSTSIIN